MRVEINLVLHADESINLGAVQQAVTRAVLTTARETASGRLTAVPSVVQNRVEAKL